MPRQLRLELSHPPGYGRAAFVVSPANAEGVARIDAWPNWPSNVLALVGSEGAGKTHLAHIWAARAGARVVSAPAADLAAVAGAAVIEEADLWPDEALFHLINRAPEEGSLLLTSRLRPVAWPSDLPDLRSRLNALSVAELREPDDALLGEVMLKLFRERNIRPADDVLPYLLRRIERSVPAARSLVARIDEAADAEQKPVTRAFVRQFLEIEPETPDLFE